VHLHQVPFHRLETPLLHLLMPLIKLNNMYWFKIYFQLKLMFIANKNNFKTRNLIEGMVKIDKIILTKRFYFWLTLFKLQYFDKTSCHYQAK
jgi:hypothetical protein